MPDSADDELDGCALDFEPDSIDDETADLFPLFPLGPDTPGLQAKAAEWREVLGGSDA
ncbi:MAG: hypothetical protein Q8K63_03560 [Acidimicrobiales bacterium]|nr:hypothetical protein [Acidimicrobiales bacterium]